MRNDFGLGDKAWSGEGAPAVNSIPAGGKERMSAGQCCAGCLGEGKLVPFPAEPACFFSIMEKNHCSAHILPGCHALTNARTLSAGSTSLIPECFCSPYVQVTPGTRRGGSNRKRKSLLPEI